MIPNNTNTIATFTNADESIAMSIDLSDMRHIMQVLSKLYSKEQEAVVREYSTNALDSHIEAGTSRPIEITLPTHNNLFFEVQDFGVGLSLDEMRAVYSMYFASTKRGTNSVAGMLGLGSKVGLAYGHQRFHVTSIKDSVKVLALVAKNEEGIGEIQILDTSDTDEANGVTIKVPVQRYDVSEFREAVTNLVQYWPKGSVLVDGEEPNWFIDRDDLIWIDGYEGDVAVINDRYHGNFVVMGNVAYPFEFPNQNAYDRKFSTVVFVDMGLVDFTPNREELNYTPGTKLTLNTLQEHLQLRLAPTVVKTIESSTVVPFERYRMMHRWSHFMSFAAMRAIDMQIDMNDGRAWQMVVRYNKRRAEHIDQERYLHPHLMDESVAVVTGFPNASMSQSHKDRLTAADGAVRLWLVLPVGARAPMLEGRKNVWKWDELPMPARKQRTKGSNAPYQYTVRLNGGDYMTPKIDAEAITYATPSRDRWSSDKRRMIEWADLHTGVHYVELTPRQVEKFLRLHPHAVHMSDYHREARKRAEEALTDEDRYQWSLLRTYGTRGFDQFAQKLHLLSDPDFRKVVSMLTSNTSGRLVRAHKLGVEIPDNDVPLDLGERYPLIAWGNSRYGSPMLNNLDDAVLYMNAKYDSLNNNSNGGTP